MKFTTREYIAGFRKAAAFRNEMLAKGILNDNGGAIHAAERILNLLGQCLTYPGVSHIRKVKDHPAAEFSIAAKKAYDRGERVFVEHVAPHRALTREAVEIVTKGATDKQLIEWIKKNYRLIHLTADETAQLNARNRTRIDSKRLGGILVWRRRK